MTTPNTPGQQPATQQWGAPQQTSYQWGQQAPYPAQAPAQPRRQVSLPWWPTWATLGLFLLTLIGSFFRFSTVRTYIGQTLIDELGLGDIGLDLGDSLGSVTVGMSWWGNFTMEGSGIGSLAMENQDEVLSDPDLQMVMVMFAVITALVLVCYGIALILGFFKKNLAMVIVGMVAVLTQALALVMVAVGQGSALEEVGEAGEVSLEAGFWIWLAAAVAGLVVFILALVLRRGQKNQPMQQYQHQQGFQQNQQFPPQGQQGPGFNPGQQGPGGGNPYQQYGR